MSSSTLFSASADGVTPPVALATVPDDPFPSYGLQAFEIDGTSENVVYLVASVSGRRDLFRVPIDGSMSPLLLTPGSFGTAFGTFELSLDGTRVVYLANPWSTSPGTLVHDVFTVRMDGSELPVKLNDSPAGYGIPGSHLGGAWGTLAVGEDRAVFLGIDRTLSAVLDGSSRTTLADVAGYQLHLTPDGRTVLFRLPVQGGGTALFETALDGSRGLREISGPSAPFGDITHWPPQVTADGSRVVCIGVLDEDGIDELFMTFLGQKVRRAPRPIR